MQMLIRFPLQITESERAPEKPESWENILGKFLIVVAVILFLIYFFFPLMDGQ